MTLLAVGAELRPCSNRYLVASGPTAANPTQRHAAAECWNRRTDKQTDSATLDSFIDPVPHTGTMRAVSIIFCI